MSRTKLNSDLAAICRACPLNQLCKHADRLAVLSRDFYDKTVNMPEGIHVELGMSCAHGEKCKVSFVEIDEDASMEFFKNRK